MSFTKNAPKDMLGRYSVRGSYRLVATTGAVTTIAARTATAGQLFTVRYPTAATAAHMYLRYLGARFTLTTAYGTAQETGCDLILARSYTVNGTNGTAVDLGSTVTTTNKYDPGFPASLITAGCCRIADTAAITAGTHTLNANPVGAVTAWSAAIGDQVPLGTSGAGGGFGVLFDARDDGYPIKITADQGFVCRNMPVMGATGVGHWDFCMIWDEGFPES